LSSSEEEKQKQEAGKNKSSIIKEMQEIRRLRVMGTDHEVIRNRLKLSPQSYRRRVKAINKIDEEYVLNEFHKEAGSEVLYLQKRFLGSLSNAESIATNEGYEPKDRIEAERLKLFCSVCLLKLYSEGPRALDIALTDGIISRSSRLQEISNNRSRSRANAQLADQSPNIIVDNNSESSSSADSTAEDDSEDNDDRRPSEEVF
jgi:hypothetical protein